MNPEQLTVNRNKLALWAIGCLLDTTHFRWTQQAVL